MPHSSRDNGTGTRGLDLLNLWSSFRGSIFDSWLSVPPVIRKVTVSARVRDLDAGEYPLGTRPPARLRPQTGRRPEPSPSGGITRAGRLRRPRRSHVAAALDDQVHPQGKGQGPLLRAGCPFPGARDRHFAGASASGAESLPCIRNWRQRPGPDRCGSAGPGPAPGHRGEPTRMPAWSAGCRARAATTHALGHARLFGLARLGGATAE